MEFIIRYGLDLEEQRITKTFGQLKWYQEHGYTPLFPASCDPKHDSVQEILGALHKEYSAQEYEQAQNSLLEGLKERKDKFFAALQGVFGKDVPDTYSIRLTKYGVGGSYGRPAGMVINFISQEVAADTVYHEIIHLMIEEDVQKYGIQHWEKERIVDLILHSEPFSFLDYTIWQKNDYNGVGNYIDPIFKEYFFSDRERFFSKVANKR